MSAYIPQAYRPNRISTRRQQRRLNAVLRLLAYFLALVVERLISA